MAILNDDEENAKNQQNTTGGGTGYVGGGYTNSGQGGMAPISAKSSAGSGSVTNIQDYLGAGNNSGGQLAGEITGQTDAMGNQAVNDTNSYQTGWNAAADAGTPGNFDSKQNAAVTYTGPQVGGPNDYGFSTAQQDVANVNAQTKNYGTPGGISSLISGLHPSSPSFTPGENALDTSLVGIEGQGMLNDNAHKWSGLNDYLGNAQQDTAAHTQAGMDKASAVNNQWKDYQAQQAKDATAFKAGEDKVAANKAAAAAKKAATPPPPPTTAAPMPNTAAPVPAESPNNTGYANNTLYQIGSGVSNWVNDKMDMAKKAKLPTLTDVGGWTDHSGMSFSEGGKVPDWSEIKKYMRR